MELEPGKDGAVAAIVASPAGLRRLAGLFVQRDYTAIWGAGAVEAAIRYTELLVVGIYTQQATGSPFLVAAMMFANAVPNALLGALTGALAERLDRRVMLLATLGFMATLSAFMAIVALSAPPALWMVAIATFLSGVCWTTEYPVRRTLLGEVAPQGQASTAITFDIATGTAMVFVGPLLGGLLMRYGGIAGFYLAATVCFVIALACIAAVRHRADRLTVSRERTLRVIAAGIGHLRRNRPVAAVLAVTVVLNFFGFSYVAMLPTIGVEKLHLGPVSIGLLLAMEGLGALIGLVLISLYTQPRVFMRLFVAGSAGFLAAIFVFANTPWFLPCLVVLFLGGIAESGFSAMQATIIFEATAPAMRRRVMGVLVMCFGMGPFGMLHAGALAEWLGADRAIAIIAIEGALLFAGCLWLWPALRRADVEAPSHS